MKGLKRWKQCFYYALFDHVELTDEQGRYTGEPRTVYKTPVAAKAHISSDKGQAVVEAFGVNTPFDSVIFWDSGDCPITETTALILDGEPQTDADGSLLYDHIVRAVARSFNLTMIAIEKVDTLDANEPEPNEDDGD